MPLPRPQRDPSLFSNIQGLIDAQMYELHTALPATVETYDAATGLVSVQPQVKGLKLDQQGERVASSLPVIVDVPLQFVGAGGARQTFPVQRGDFVWLIFSEASLALWKARAVEVDPEDERRHHIHDAIALLGVRPPASPWTGADVEATTWGYDGGLQIHITVNQIQLGGADATEAAAIAAKTDARLAHLEAAFNSHVHLATGPTAPTLSPTLVPGVIPVETALPVGPGVVGTTASSTVKIKP